MTALGALPFDFLADVVAREAGRVTLQAAHTPRLMLKPLIGFRCLHLLQNCVIGAPNCSTSNSRGGLCVQPNDLGPRICLSAHSKFVTAVPQREPDGMPNRGG